MNRGKSRWGQGARGEGHKGTDFQGLLTFVAIVGKKPLFVDSNCLLTPIVYFVMSQCWMNVSRYENNRTRKGGREEGGGGKTHLEP